MDKIKELLCQCLEIHYDSLDKYLSIPGKEQEALRKIRDICDQSIS